MREQSIAGIKKWCLLLIGGFLMLSAHAFTQSLDSLKQALFYQDNLMKKADLCNEITWISYQNKKDSCLFYAQKALTFTQENELHKPLLIAHLQFAEILRSKQDLIRARVHLDVAKKILRKHNFPSQEPRFLLFRGSVEFDQQHYKNAIQYFREGYDLCLSYNQELRLDFLRKLGDLYQEIDSFNKAEFFIKKGLNSEKNEVKIEIFHELGKLHYKQQHYKKALPFYQKSLDLSKECKDSKNESRAILNIGNIYMALGHWTKAINYYLESAAIKEKLGDKRGLARLHNNIAATYKQQKRYSESLEYYEKSRIYYSEVQDSVKLVRAWVNIAFVNIFQKNYQISIDLLNKSLQVLSQTKDEFALLVAYYNLAFVYNEIGKSQLSLNYLELSEKEAQKQNALYSMGNIANLYGACYLYLKAYPKAIGYYKKGLRLGQELGLLVQQETALFGLYETERKMGDYRASLIWLEEYNIIKDSLVIFRADRQLVELQEKYDAKQKEQKISQLNVENINIELESELKTKQFNLLLMGSSIVLLIMGMLILFFYYRQRQQKITLKHASALHKEKINQLIDKQEIATLDAVFAAQQNERRSLAKDIHDTLGSFLATIKYQHEAGKRITSTEKEAHQYAVMEKLIGQACKEVRSISHQMATGEQMRFNLIKAINDLIQRIKNTQQFDVDFDYFGDNNPLPQEMELMLYRIVQELFSNVLKHAEATQAMLQINQGETEIVLMMEDNGKGFDVKGKLPNGLGLTSIAERVEEMNGRLDIDARIGRGTAIIITIPVLENNIT